MSQQEAETESTEPWSKQRWARLAGNASLTALAVYGWIQLCEEVLFPALF